MSLSLNEKLCHAQHSLLLIIDIQERLAGAMPEKVVAKVIKNNSILLDAAKELNIPVIHSEQYPNGLGHTMPSLSVKITSSDNLITKTSFACSNSDGFNELVAQQNKQQIIISGIETHICVLQSALHLQRLGYAVYVIEDAVCSRKNFNHMNAIERLRHSDVVVSNVESVLFEWLEDASHPKFKTLSNLIK